MKSFRITGGKGFQVTFPNKVTLSTQFGACNYCDNRSMGIDLDMYISPPTLTECDNAEVAIWDEDDVWITKEMMRELYDDEIMDDVIGHVDMVQWPLIVDWCRNYKKGE